MVIYIYNIEFVAEDSVLRFAIAVCTVNMQMCGGQSCMIVHDHIAV